MNYANTYITDLEIRDNCDYTEFSCVLNGYIEQFLEEFIPEEKATKINGDNNISQIWDEALTNAEKENCVY